MKDFQLLMNLRGIRPSYKNPINSEFLTNLTNASVEENGLYKHEDITLAVSQAKLNAESISANWPWPVFFRGAGSTYLVEEAKLWEVDESTWSISEVTTYQHDDQTQTKAITGDGVWRFMDFGGSWFLVNGMETVFSAKHFEMVGESNKVLVQDSVYIETCCAFRGRGLFAGFDSSAFWSDAWKQFFLERANRTDFGFAEDIDITDNLVWASSIGGGDLLWLFYPDIFLNGYMEDDGVYGESRPFVMELLEKNQFGFYQMPFRGRVKDVHPMRDVIIVGGEDGVSLMLPATVGDTPTFGVRPLLSHVGLASTGAIGGNEELAVFVSDTGVLYQVSGNGDVNRLGYQEVFEDLLGNNILVKHADDQDGNSVFFIGDGNEEYKLTRWGLSRVGQHITSCFTHSGSVIGYAQDDSTLGDTIQIDTDIFDMGFRGMKTITMIEMEGSMDSTDKSWQAAVSWRINKGSAFAITDYRTTNREGVVYIPTNGFEFKLHMKGSDYNNVDPPSRAIVHWIASDKRYKRGAFQVELRRG